MRVDNGKEFCAKHCANCFINSTLFTSKNHHMGAKKRPEKLSESPLLPSTCPHSASWPASPGRGPGAPRLA